MTEVETKIIAIIAKELSLPQQPELTDSLDKFEADSLDRAEIVFSIEDEFGIDLKIPDKETALKIFSTVQSIADFVTGHLETK
jgi:acyl carrier protein